MDFKELNTPSDLVAANKVTDPVQEAFKRLMSELDGIQALELTAELLQQLGGWHAFVANKATDEGDHERAMEWAKDEVLLEESWQLVKRVYNNSIDE